MHLERVADQRGQARDADSGRGDGRGAAVAHPVVTHAGGPRVEGLAQGRDDGWSVAAVVVHLDGAAAQTDALGIRGVAEFRNQARPAAADVECDDPGVNGIKRRFINNPCVFGHPVILTRNQGKVV
ncbi:hypothetical protein GCM10017772_11170 [Promicromonospora soli]|uniref:Uncharacterized protein n=1 Tax=Promicromonospora soli TaxID=2035533 RepID=A0A919FL98_9MICO|nr:hypothetical protein GCM10017772_11170 [Promicromonospora soli]